MVERRERVERRESVVHIGGVYATREPTVLKTVLGSCIAVCLSDPRTGVGGMNHFMLPVPGTEGDDRVDAPRFGVHAMDLLIGRMLKAGADRRRLEARIFGGATLMGLPENGSTVGERNIAFIEEFMQFEDLVVVGRDLGGHLPRQIRFLTDTGKAYVRRLGRSTLTRVEEQEHLRQIRRRGLRFGEITLFE
jgi:chemotaxis protein CheD